MHNKENTSSRSEQLNREARQYLPGGVSRNTIFREPCTDYADFGKGCFVTDVDGKRRIDLANNMASLIHGHAHPEIVAAVTEQLNRGTAFTMATEAELQLARLLCERVPWFEKIRFMNSGTEAVMAAIKASRAITGRPMIAKCEGTYHGTYDYAEVSQNSTPGQWGDHRKPARVPVAAGTPVRALDDVVVIPFNNVEQSLELLDQHARQLACILIDLVPHRSGLIAANREFVTALRSWATHHDVLLVFDEVISFRMAYSGAAEWYNVQPDLTTLGKIIGGGFPVGALAGKEQYMSVLDPDRDKIPFPWSGTFSANPVTMTAGRVAMELFDQAAIERLNELGDQIRKRISDAIELSGLSACVTGAGSMFRIHMKPDAPTDYRSAWQDDQQRSQIKSLVDYLYHHGYMLFRTCTGALSTPVTENEVAQFTEQLKCGLTQVEAIR